MGSFPASARCRSRRMWSGGFTPSHKAAPPWTRAGTPANGRRGITKPLGVLPTGERKVRFVPTSARETPQAMDLLCRNYRQACQGEAVPPLLILSTPDPRHVGLRFPLHSPFRDGNGRVARLFTTLLLQSHGFEVARYISLERMVEASPDESIGFPASVRAGGLKANSARPAKGDLVRRTVLAQVASCARHLSGRAEGSRQDRLPHAPISSRRCWPA
jgi:hypothetical protein